MDPQQHCRQSCGVCGWKAAVEGRVQPHCTPLCSLYKKTGAGVRWMTSVMLSDGFRFCLRAVFFFYGGDKRQQESDCKRVSLRANDQCSFVTFKYGGSWLTWLSACLSFPALHCTRRPRVWRPLLAGSEGRIKPQMLRRHWNAWKPLPCVCPSLGHILCPASYPLSQVQ